jgi:hypothetical protein
VLLYGIHVYWNEGGRLDASPKWRNIMSTLQVSKVRATLLAIVFVGASLSPASQAQDPEGKVVVKVPFAFEDGSQHFSPGLYTISAYYRNVANIRGESISGFVTPSVDDNRQPSQTTKVVFHRYGSQYFIEQIWVAGETTHTRFLLSKAERLEIAANKTAPTDVVVAALEPPR